MGGVFYRGQLIGDKLARSGCCTKDNDGDAGQFGGEVGIRRIGSNAVVRSPEAFNHGSAAGHRFDITAGCDAGDSGKGKSASSGQTDFLPSP